MKKKYYSILLLIFITLQSCVTQRYYYSSDADLPYFHNATKTDLQLIYNEEDKHEFGFGIIQAIDNDTLNYVLLAPNKGGHFFIDQLTDVNLKRSIPLNIAQGKEFMSILNNSINDWENEYPDTTGINYEFMVAPEHKIKQASENVNTWYPTLKYYYQNNNFGSRASLIFGQGVIKREYRFTEINHVKQLNKYLELAIRNN